MKLKNTIITALTVIFVIISLSLILSKAFDININFINHHKITDGEYTFTFKGTFKTVRAVKISKDSKKLCSLPFNATSDIFSDDYSIKWDDVNFDGVSDPILICATDDDGDVHYTAFINDQSNNTFIYYEALADLPNLKLDSEIKALFTSYTLKNFVEDPKPNTPDNYELKTAIARYEYLNGVPVAMEERATTFYSETYYYCYSVYKYNEKYGKLTYSDEQWFSPDKLDEHPLNWD